MELFKETSYISGGNFLSSQNKKKTTLKKFLIFRETELFSPKLKKFLHFSKNNFSYILGGNLQSLKNNIS